MRAVSCLLLGLLTCAAARREIGAPKNAAVAKVLELMNNLQTKVLEEGEKEAQSYNKFACWCKSTLAEKHADMKEAEDQITSLTARIEDAFAARTEADDSIAELTTDIAALEKDLAKEKAAWQELYDQYMASEDDLATGGSSLRGAIKEMKAGCSGPAGFLQVSDAVRKQVRAALELADVFGYQDKNDRTLAFFQEDQPTQDYECHNGAATEMLEGLLTKFRKKETDTKQDEKQDSAKHEMKMQRLTNDINAKNTRLEQAKQESGRQTASLTADAQKRTEWSAGLMQDTQFTQATSKDCTQAALTWDERSRTRAGELQALTTAIGIVKDQVAGQVSENTVRLVQSGYTVKLAESVAKNQNMMQAIEAEAEAADSSVSFLAISKHTTHHDSPAGVAALKVLREKGQELKSTLLASVASQIATLNSGSADPFAKIKTLIEELVKRLLTEAANEANQKGWCDKSMGDAERKRDEASRRATDLNAQMAQEEADINQFTGQIADLEKKLADLSNETATATDMRNTEKAENAATVQEAEVGRDAITSAMEVLQEFYGNAAKNPNVDVSLAQSTSVQRPDPGFKNGENYQGGQGASGGILGMMEVIKSDFVRTIETTNKAEQQAEADFLEFQTNAEMSIMESKTIKEDTSRNLASTRESLSDNTQSLDEEMQVLSGAIEELITLKSTCVDTGMSYEERVARREDEIAALKQSLCILENSANGDAAAEEC